MRNQEKKYARPCRASCEIATSLRRVACELRDGLRKNPPRDLMPTIDHDPDRIALSLLLAAPAMAQEVRFHDAQGRVTGGARIDANGVTTFHDARRSRHPQRAHRRQRRDHLP